MAQFQEMMRQQLETLMYTELEKLLDNTTEAEKEVQITLTHSLCLRMTIWLWFKGMVGSRASTWQTQEWHTRG